MCAIFAFSGKLDNQLLRGLFKNAASHGPHGVGLAYVENNRLNVFKRAIHPEIFLRNCNHRIERASKYPLGFGHVRYATHGQHTDRNSHPFQHDDVTFCHNGIIRNYRELSPNVEVDSECLGPLIKQRNIAPAQGSVGLIWFEGLELFALRQGQRLTAFTFTFAPDDKLTIVATVKEIIPRSLFQMRNSCHVLEQGVAYKVCNSGLEEVWRSPLQQQEVYRNLQWDASMARTACSVDDLDVDDLEE